MSAPPLISGTAIETTTPASTRYGEAAVLAFRNRSPVYWSLSLKDTQLTAQLHDKLRDGQMLLEFIGSPNLVRMNTCAKALEPVHPRLCIGPQEDHYTFSACWRGYVAAWTISPECILTLTSVTPYGLPLTLVGVSPIAATWISGSFEARPAGFNGVPKAPSIREYTFQRGRLTRIENAAREYPSLFAE